MLCVVCHDAGGAEVVASYIARTNTPCRYVLEGPALKVFARRLGKIETIDLEHALQTCDEFLCGTSWQSSLEWDAVAGAREKGKICRSFLDHWGHYRERFVRHGTEILPDEIWAGDDIGARMVREMFPHIPVHLEPNPYFQDIRDEFDRLDPKLVSSAGLRVLFVCEPLSEHGLMAFGDALHWGYTEFDALSYFFAHLDVFEEPVSRIVIRPHPSEKPGKYEEIRQALGPLAVIGGTESLLQEIADADIVAGCESMALVVGLIAGRRVISTIPPQGRLGGLPQPEIEILQELVQFKRTASS